MLVEQIVEFKLRGPGALVIHVLLQLVSFMTNQKSFMENLQMDRYLKLKYCRRQCTLLPLTWAKSITKFNPKVQDF